MSIFILCAILLTLGTLALLLYPLLGRGTRAFASQRQLNAAIYRDQLHELERDYAEGCLAEADYQHDRDELKRRLLEDTAGAEPSAVAEASGKRTALVLLVLLPMAAAGLYAGWGAPEALDPTVAQHRAGADEIGDMVAGLAARLEKNPDDLNGWMMLGRSYRAMGRFEEAVKALDHAMPIIEKDAALLAIYADLLAASADGNLEGKPRQMIERALKLDPNAPEALDLAASAAFNRGDFRAAIEYWTHLQKQLPPDSDYARALAASIAEARTKSPIKTAPNSPRDQKGVR